MRKIKITGYIHIDESEYDDGPLGPLTEDANTALRLQLIGLEDIDFEDVTE